MDGLDNSALHTKVCVSKTTKNINIYRALTLLRIGALAFFLKYRLSNPLKDASGIWILALCCEILFIINFLVYSILKWRPAERTTYIDRLSSMYEKPGEVCLLCPVDVFITSADPLKESSFVTANTILSVLAADYPPDKISCFVSDDSASPITFSMMVEVSKFAQMWVPFCHKFSIEPRAPAPFFSSQIDISEKVLQSSYFEHWKALKEEYEQFKFRVNSLERYPEEALKQAREQIPWPTVDARNHPPIVHEVLGHKNSSGSEEWQTLPRLVYVAREKRAEYNHHFKAGAVNALMRVSGILSSSPFILNLDCDMYINDSKALKHAMCFLMDPNLEETVAFVQFPQVFDNLDAQDVYGNRIIFLYDVLFKGLDGIQGPYYAGTGCVHRRRALYGYKPGTTQEWHSESLEYCRAKFGHCPALIKSVVSDLCRKQSESDDFVPKEAVDLCRYNYEDSTSWGRKIGWIYGSSTEDILTGYKLHCLGWRSIYFWPTRPAFRGVAPVTASDRLAQRKRVAAGLVKIFFSHCSPVFYGSQGLMFMQRIAYLYMCFFYAGISVFVVLYSTLHAACLLSGRSLTPKISNPASIWFVLAICFQQVMSYFEYLWAEASVEEWWNQERFWLVSNLSAFLFGTVEAVLKSVGVGETEFTVSPKSRMGENNDDASIYVISNSPLFIPLATLAMLSLYGMLVATVHTIRGGMQMFDTMCLELLCGTWSLLMMYPILYQILTWPKGTRRVPLYVMLPSVGLTALFGVMVEICLSV